MRWLIIVLIIAAILKFGFFSTREPKFVPLLSGPQLSAKMKDAQEPVFVFFYHSSWGTRDARNAYFPILNQFAQRLVGNVLFYRYKESEQPPDPFFNKYWHNGASFVLFKNGQEVKRWPVALLARNTDNWGNVFIFLGKYAGLPRKSYSSAEPLLTNLRDADFKSAVLDSHNFVIVDFTSPTCPAAATFKPSFSRVAQMYQERADFYYYDVTQPAVNSLGHSFKSFPTPTIGFYNDGKLVKKVSGAYSTFAQDQSLVAGLLAKYYYTN